MFKDKNLPYNIYYSKLLSQQEAFIDLNQHYKKSDRLINQVISIPIHPYMEPRDLRSVANLLNCM
jgi:dTDP-4-amino-4,6-dideoxygalactose transaminase